MMSIQKILAPIDFSPRCAWAARYASNLAARLKAELFYLHVGDPSSETKLKEFVGPGARHCSSVVPGDPAEAIVEFAKDHGIDLIVMPTHAHGRFRRFLIGSVTAKVLHDAHCPVWTGVHHADAPPPDRADIRNIVCAVESDAFCVPLIHWSRSLSEILDARVHLVHAVPAADETSDNRGEIELRQFLFGRAEAEFASLFKAAGITAEVSLAGGPIAAVIRESALRLGADLVVIGRGHTQAGIGRLRTHAYAVIRESPCPVVSI
jgi:nucleotide-binding universal stress UspA family protein